MPRGGHNLGGAPLWPENRSLDEDGYTPAMTSRLTVAIALSLGTIAAAQQPAAPARAATPPVMVGQKDGFFTTNDGVKIL